MNDIQLIDYRNYLDEELRDIPLFTSRKIRFEDVTLPTFKRTFYIPKNALEIDLDDIPINSHPYDMNYNKLPLQKEIIGMDTETLDGKVKMIADSDGNVLQPNSFEEFIEWLELFERNKTVNMFYNLNYDVRAFLHMLDLVSLSDLAEFNECEFNGIKLIYIPSKFFSISFNKKRYNFYDIFQFYWTSLNKASLKYLGKQKIDIDINKMNDPQFWIDNLQEITDYCIYDSVLCRDLAILSQTQYNELGLNFNSPVSTASLSEQFALRYSTIPKYNLTYIQRFGYYSYFGGWFEQFQKGYFEEAYKYDLNSAYPAIMSELPDLNHGKWLIQNFDDLEQDFGFVRVKYISNDKYILPNPVLTNTSLQYPILPKHRRYLTLKMYRFILEHNLANMEIEEFAIFYPESSYKPFAYLKDIYAKRLKLKLAKDFRQLPLKYVMNSIYGKNIQIITKKGETVVHKAGQLYNPAYASHITDGTRLELLNFTLNNDIRPLAFYTDAVLTLDEVNVSSSKLGEWDLEKKGELVAIGSGVYAMRSGDNIDSHHRGFGSKIVHYCNSCKKHSLEETCNHIEPMNTHLFELIDKYSNKTHIPMNIRRPLSHKEVVSHKVKREFNHVNQWLNFSKELDINFDSKRRWNSSFSRASDILSKQIDSKPINYII